jgi:tRNA/tmRNA/rRNA uracil-C5-methylase (TrmA/RlmC/RlmD family)
MREESIVDDGVRNDQVAMKSSLPTKKEDSREERKAQKRKRKRTTPKPKPGEEGYKTPTQLRNERKRKQAKRRQQPKIDHDPSQQYLSNPKGAPSVNTARHYFQNLKTDFCVSLGPTEGWRTVAKLAVRPSTSAGQVTIGLFSPNSHRLVPVPQCVAHHSSINAAILMVEKLSRQIGVKPFDETIGTGHLRHIAVNVERATEKVQITLVWNSKPHSETSVEDEGKKDLDTLCKVMIAAAGGNSTRKRRRGHQGKESTDETCEPMEEMSIGLHSLWVHYNSSWKHSNAIFSVEGGKECWEHRYGPLCITETLELTECGLKHSVPLRFPPNVFRQANIDAFAMILAEIRRRISKFGRQRRQQDRNAALPTCVELYGGVGTIGLHVVDLVSSLVSSDENPFNEASFNESALALPNDLSKRVSYKSMNATNMVHSKELERAEVVIVDPPRKGLDDIVLQTLCTEASTQFLVYVSCGFDAFQHDCNALLKSKWSLDHAEGYLLFPGSDAIETLAIFVAKI